MNDIPIPYKGLNKGFVIKGVNPNRVYSYMGRNRRKLRDFYNRKRYREQLLKSKAKRRKRKQIRNSKHIDIIV